MIRRVSEVGAAVALFCAAAALFVTAAVAQREAKPGSSSGGDPKNQACIRNLQQIRTGLMIYVRDFDGMLPPMESAAQFQSALRSHVKNQAVFTCPVTKQPYQPNGALSRKTRTQIRRFATTPLTMDARPHPDGTRNAVLGNGRVVSRGGGSGPGRGGGRRGQGRRGNG